MGFREDAIEVLTTHRHGEKKRACAYCAAFYGGIVDTLMPLVREVEDEARYDEAEHYAQQFLY